MPVRTKGMLRERKTANQISYANLFWLFMLGSMAGFVLEGVWCILRKGHWERHAATVWGPFCIIYGIGAVVVYLLAMLLQKRGLVVRFAAFSAAGAVVEYCSSLFQEVCFGSVSWNYSAHFLNLGGRVSLKMSLLWGVLRVVFVWLIFPTLNRMFAKMRGRGWRIGCVVLSLFMVMNLIVSAAAVTRWRNRLAGQEQQAGRMVQILDEVYDDDTMSELFPNMKFEIS